jgi:methylsterol monooxygenase
MDNDNLATGVLLLVVHEAVYFGRSLPWLIMDMMPYFRKYKIQEAKVPTTQEYWQCLQSVFLSHIFVEALPIFGFFPVCQFFNIAIAAPFPNWTTIALQVSVFFIVEDTWHYWGHRVLHTPWLYKNIHKQHHKYAAPFGLTAEYAHPVEVAFTGAGTVGSPIVWAYFMGNLHLVTVLLWIVLRLLQAVDSHSGYDFPWSLRHFMPFWSGAEHHDDHHKYFTGNYASSFRWWDYILGTETNATVKKRANAKKTK